MKFVVYLVTDNCGPCFLFLEVGVDSAFVPCVGQWEHMNIQAGPGIPLVEPSVQHSLKVWECQASLFSPGFHRVLVNFTLGGAFSLLAFALF